MAISAHAQTWNIDQAHTNAQFSVRHMGISTVRGSFTKVSGTVHHDPADES
jgi:polyisoprenoid-binding protein YceI